MRNIRQEILNGVMYGIIGATFGCVGFFLYKVILNYPL